MPLTVQQLRAAAGGLSNLTDEQVVKASYEYYKPYYPKFDDFARTVGYAPEDDFVRGVKIAGRNTLAAGAGAVAAGADALGFQGARDSALRYGREQAGLARQMGRESDNVDNFSKDPMSFLSAGAGQAVGYAVPSLVAGGVGGLAARAAIGAGTAGTVAGAAAGSYANNLAQETGSIYNELTEQGKYEPGRALAYGAGAAALDTVPEMVGLGRLVKPAAGGLARRMARGIGAGAATEAGTEVAQTAVERAGAYKPLTGDEAMSEYRNAAALGAIGGGMFGAATGYRAAPSAPQPSVDQPGGGDLLQTPGAGPEGWRGLESYGQSDGPLYSAQPQVAPTPAVGQPRPDQYDLFNPNGTPTYGADNWGGDSLDKPSTVMPAMRTGLRQAAQPAPAPNMQPFILPQDVQGDMYRQIADKADAGQPLTPTEENILNTYSSVPRAPGPVQPIAVERTSARRALPDGRPGLELNGNPTPQFELPQPVVRPDFELTSPDNSQGELDFGAPVEQPLAPPKQLRSNQRGFIDELPFTPPEARINTPAGKQLYGLAESLTHEGFVDETTLDQVTTLLTQSKLAQASKIINQALADKKAAQGVMAKAEKNAQEAAAKAVEAQAKAAEAKPAQTAAVSEKANTSTTDPITIEQSPERVSAKVDKYDRLIRCLKG